MKKRGDQLKAGDVIKTWWQPGTDRITCLEPYRGPLASLFPAGAQIAGFALANFGMTIDNSDLYEVVE